MTELSERLEKAEQERSGAIERDGTPTIYEQLRKMEGQFASALPSHIRPDQFLRVALTELRLKPDLQTCSTPSLLGALMLSAQLGLVPGPLGHVYLVPYANRHTRTREVQFQIGYKGFIELASRSGIAISGGIVREGDTIDYQLGTDPWLIHRPNVRAAGEPFLWYVVAEIPNGKPKIEVLNREQIESFRKRSQAAKSGPWVTDFDAMALKTVVRRIVKWLPLSTEQAGAMATDESRPLWQASTHELTVAHDEPELMPEPEDEPTTEPEDEPTTEPEDEPTTEPEEAKP